MYTSTFSSIIVSLLSISTITKALPLLSRYPQSQAGPEALQDRDTAIPTARAVINTDFPDPSFIKLPDATYAFATSANGKNIQVAKSASITDPTWTVLNIDALPDPGPWTDHTANIWAPYIAQTPSGSFVMYYSAPPLNNVTRHCIGTATSKSITGPYIPSTTPFACDLLKGGAIDPSLFRDPKTSYTYVMYKVDGNSLGGNAPTPIFLQRVNPTDLTTKLGAPVQIFDQDFGPSDGDLVEAPTMMYANGIYYLLFSTNNFTTEKYDVRYVTSNAVTGPFSTTQNVLLRTGDGNGIVGPGSCDVHDGMIVFHGRVSTSPFQRFMYAGFVRAEGGKLSYMGPV